MDQFIKALKAGDGFDYLANSETCADLTLEDLRDIAKELIYAIECKSVGLLQSEIYAIYDGVSENLIQGGDSYEA